MRAGEDGAGKHAIPAGARRVTIDRPPRSGAEMRQRRPARPPEAAAAKPSRSRGDGPPSAGGGGMNETPSRKPRPAGPTWTRPAPRRGHPPSSGRTPGHPRLRRRSEGRVRLGAAGRVGRERAGEGGRTGRPRRRPATVSRTSVGQTGVSAPGPICNVVGVKARSGEASSGADAARARWARPSTATKRNAARSSRAKASCPEGPRRSQVADRT
jgi:hypothetical protein